MVSGILTLDDLFRRPGLPADSIPIAAGVAVRVVLDHLDKHLLDLFGGLLAHDPDTVRVLVGVNPPIAVPNEAFDDVRSHQITAIGEQTVGTGQPHGGDRHRTGPEGENDEVADPPSLPGAQDRMRLAGQIDPGFRTETVRTEIIIEPLLVLT